MTEAEALSSLVAAIYDTALDANLWPAALQGIQDYVGGCAANFYWQDVTKESAGVFHCVGIAPEYLESYFQTYTRLNPFYPAGAFYPRGIVVSVDEVTPPSELVQTRFFQEWMRPQGMRTSLVVNLEKSAASVAAVAVIQGADKDFDEDQGKRRLQLLAPHILRASSIGRIVSEYVRERATLTDLWDRVRAGVFLLNGSGRVVFANRAGVALADAGEILKLSGSRLVASKSAANIALQSALAATRDADRADLNLRTPIALSDRPDEPWRAHVLPLTSPAWRNAIPYAANAVIVNRASLEITSPLEAVTRLYKLTGSEARVLEAVVAVGGVPEIAVALGVSESTVRSHLKRLFEKTGAHRQIELAKLLAAHALPF